MMMVMMIMMTMMMEEHDNMDYYDASMIMKMR